MKYTIALFIGLAQAGECNYRYSQNTEKPFSTGSQSQTSDVALLPNLVDGELTNQGLVNSLGDIAGNYLLSGNTDKENIYEQASASPSQIFDDKQDDLLCIDQNPGSQSRRAYLIDDDATRVNANYESCTVGETIIPAVSEQTNVKQAACFSSDSAAQYNLKGTATNNYKITGDIEQDSCQTQQGSETTTSALCLKGSKSKKYCQSGNKALGGCDCDGFGLDGKLLDDAALDVTANPSEKVQEQVEEVMMSAISKLVSDAVSHCINVSLKNSIQL